MMVHTNITTNADGTKRGLKKKHVQMIAIGGTIGTGLFLGAGNSIARTGPSILIVYAVLGAFFFLMMRGIGEMLYADPSQHTFVSFISKYVSPGAGYFAGWSYWIGLVFVAMAELTAVSTYVKFWFPHWQTWIIQIAFLAILTLINLISVKYFGETEYWFAMIKIIAIVAMIVTGLVLIFTGFQAPASGGHTIASFSNITHHFSMFPNGVGMFISAFPMVFFAFQGMEFVGITTAETQNPRAVLPQAINTIIIRILIFYLGAMTIIMSIINWHVIAKTPDQSPFVMVFQLAGLRAAAVIINFVVLTSAASALNSAIYSAGRHFYQLAEDSNTPIMSHFKKISTHGVPANAILLTAILVLLSPVINAIPQITSAFGFITAISSNMYIIVYTMTMYAHRKFRESSNYLPDGFTMPGYKFTSPLTLLFFFAIYLSLFFQSDSRVSAIGAVIFTIVFGYLAHRKFANVATDV
ncbi:amino acid permease [Leuconostoc gelidum]|mgnify:CR=1 FL=1|uniref:amino acid permease n=1 Tax=Leuconostoc gelidum TaxID=1244 RepID=UPI0002193D2D|nr:amino acid permease [Leuconostoc gelidum]AFS40569.1 amino acid transport protein [Leuconostoc gelidum JB7]MBZ5978470.1 amino acid permease [Leuconostoc gelidum subsp. gelidum]MBZ5991591.1 amino acid permease [Leuconostoc gelidum subsp. gelidum]USP17999.1 amino acid permease [Leuconostoc gelidum subsp. aenigmaticum]GMA68059.1 amino acid permease [Leuconostoc gelidum subsp. gelidum]